MDKQEIRKLAQDCGFNLRLQEDGSIDLNPYVYVFAERLLNHKHQECEVSSAEQSDLSPAHDPVNYPSHYTSHPSGVEAIEITRHMGFNLGNAMKYLWRNGLKDGQPAVQDLEKAVWYIQDEIKRLKSATGKNL